ncbi:hypothetical protein ACJ73_04349 [Blastomyces percursus]|uniref:Uncharacterized protein n=1 Tax=Blastomyces percursus TaxID=1658174 RepID=A0A1J9Q6D7_9EURO|nr:hypothetical protein ACJ73_04349 [Blastomyces percursus]
MFEIITGLGMYGNIQASNAILVETDTATGTFQTHLVGTPKEHTDDAMVELHNEVTKKIYEKLSMGLD